MTPEAAYSLCVFAFVTSITPGPNNALLLSSGVNFGLRRTLPHLLGVTLGFTFMQLALGLGVGMIFEAVPGLYTGFRVLGLGYMLYLAWAIGTSLPPATLAQDDAPAQQAASAQTAASARPMTFLQASAFQWVNPKALMMCITAASTYAPPDQPVLGALLVTAAFLVVGMPCCGAWAVLGSFMRGLLQDQRKLRVFNWAMAVALVASAAPMARGLLPGGLF
ncbi:MAG: lysine transporter LysE [Deltaproteobacteria bacterium HGW-Deltaproteobacteria-8]|jgi:threonine/homoserine/homoserine lactone efflux protein|nr:MAG: lysine transporter LysE [Deltaproteobacteria bacterium HGW-Deltaproteobacteria-8]